ncbi:MAG TPA: radical SAM protein, partial [Kofleriaceae bacterium]|nr:radical SAM protein [Kofleriaceae bacterium]
MKPIAGLSAAELRARVLAGIDGAAPLVGPQTVHIDVTNACNAACVTCWDHSPLLREPRPVSWKKRRLDVDTFADLVTDLDAMGSVRSVILSGMGEPLVHPDIYRMIALVKRHGWHLTMLTNLVAADIDQLAESGVDQLLVGVQGATPRAYTAFHPGWTEQHFATMCRYLRALRGAGVACRHVQVINRDTAPELVAMVRFGRQFHADRVNFKLASLYGGTEDTSITTAQRDWLLAEAIPEARALSAELGVPTNLALFEAQVAATAGHMRATTPIADIGCFMGYVYTRVTVDLEVLYCCNTAVRVGSLREAPLSALWFGPAWQALRGQLRDGQYLAGCDKCGKFEQ